MALRESRSSQWIICLLLLPTTVLSAEPVGAPFSSPTAIRENSIYLRTHDDGTNLPPFDGAVFKSVAIERVADELTVKYGTSQELGRTLYGAITHHKAKGVEPIQIAAGSMRLAYVGVVPKLPPGVEMARDLVLPPQYFTPDLNPAHTNDPILQLQPHRQPLSATRLPSARFIFVCSNLTDFVTWQFHAFDARTHYPLCNWDYQATPFRETIQFNTPLKLWHQTPIELVVTLAMGPTQIYSMAAVEGSELKLPIGGIKLLAISDGRFGDIKPGPPEPGTVTFTKNAHDPNDPRDFSLVFYCSPPVGSAAWEFEFYDNEGKQMDGWFKSGYGAVSIRAVNGLKENLKEIRVKYFPNLHRLSFTIPELPGLPEENRNITNLFDVHVPHIRTGSHLAMHQALRDLVQMEVKNVPFDPRKKPLQSERTNTTSRAIFEEIDQGMPEHHHLHVDPERHVIQGVSRKPPGPPEQFRPPPNLELN
jgi:hypothetical protein